MNGTNFIVKDIQQIVKSMQVDGVPYYDYGHRLEIASRLMKQNNSQQKYNKYPIIALRLDIGEDVNAGLISPTLNIVIATVTNQNYIAQQRYDNVIIPVLYPLYRKFINALRDTGIYFWPNISADPPHKRIDRPYWGTTFMEGNDKNIFSDPIDAIEILNLKLTKTNKC